MAPKLNEDTPTFKNLRRAFRQWTDAQIAIAKAQASPPILEAGDSISTHLHYEKLVAQAVAERAVAQTEIYDLVHKLILDVTIFKTLRLEEK